MSQKNGLWVDQHLDTSMVKNYIQFKNFLLSLKTNFKGSKDTRLVLVSAKYASSSSSQK